MGGSEGGGGGGGGCGLNFSFKLSKIVEYNTMTPVQLLDGQNVDSPDHSIRPVYNGALEGFRTVFLTLAQNILS